MFQQEEVLHKFDCDLMKKLAEKIMSLHDRKAVFEFYGGAVVEL